LLKIPPSYRDDNLANTYHKTVKITQHLLISGHVQGVSFRFFTKDCAIKLGVTGWVRNLSDKRVEALVQGLPEQLKALQEKLQRGPAAAEVKSIEVQVVSTQKDMKEFIIEADGVKPCLKK
jgi:acylphosphatase